MTFLQSNVSDPLTGENVQNRRAATLSIFNQDLLLYDKAVVVTDPFTQEHVITNQYFTLNRFNFDTAHEFLIPRAVAYSAGLIDYFFRGRLSGEDVEVTETGVRLRIKNAIDPVAMPAWKDEKIYAANSAGARGKFVVAFEYENASGETRYGTSSEVAAKTAAEGGGDMAPGTVSPVIYEFALSIPADAKDVKYRLVFRGKLGQEDDAIAVGVIEPVSGFLVTPDYNPSDNISGPRAIYKRGGEWILDEKPNLQAGTLDWKGWYVNGRPTKVLSYRGPSKRYFPALGLPDYGSEIYQNGTVWSVAPLTVLGAAITKDSNGAEWLVTICSNGINDFVYRRPNKKSTSSALYDPITAPEGWHEVPVTAQLTGTKTPDRAWFFNGRGTEAQTLRPTTSNNPTNDPNHVTRLKMTLSTGSAVITDLGNSRGWTFSSIYQDSKWSGTPGDCRVGASGTARRTETFNWKPQGEPYVIAVDYRDGTEVLAKVIIGGEISRTDQHIAAWTISACDPVTGEPNAQATSAVELSTSSNIITSLAAGDSAPIPMDKDYYQETINFITGQHGASSLNFLHYTMLTQQSGTFSRNYDTYWIHLSYLDLRSPVRAGLETIDQGVFTRSLSENELCVAHPAYSLSLDDAVYHGSQELRASHFAFTNPGSSCRARNSFSEPRPLGLGLGPDTGFPKPPQLLLNKDVRGSWVVDSGDNLFVSQTTITNGIFNYLTDGDILSTIPIAPEGSRYYPAMVLR